MKIYKIRRPGRKTVERAVLSAASGKVAPYAMGRIIKKFTSNPDCVLYTASGKGGSACAFRTDLRWDSGIFGFKIGRIEEIFLNMGRSDGERFFRRMVRDCQKERFAHINCRVRRQDKDVLRTLIKLKFFVADRQVTLRNGRSFKNISKPAFVRPMAITKASRKDLPGVKELVKGIFTDTRFVVDHRYPRDGVDRMYYEWVKNSILNPDHTVFLVRDTREGSLAGFCICDVDRGSRKTLGYVIGGIDLIAVKAQYRGMGVGMMLVRHCLDWLKKSCDRAEIRTQVSNRAAIRAFRKGGFGVPTCGIMQPAGITLHRWF